MTDKELLASLGLEVVRVNRPKPSRVVEDRPSLAAPYDPAIWDESRDQRIRMMRHAFGFALGKVDTDALQMAEAVFMASRSWSRFHLGCKTVGALAGLSPDWAHLIYTTSAFLQHGPRHLRHREQIIRHRIFRSFVVWVGPQCHDSPHARVTSLAGPVGDPVWNLVKPPFDYSCGCMVNGSDASFSPLRPDDVPSEALAGYDWMSHFPSHLHLLKGSRD